MKELTLKASVENIASATEYIDSCLESLDCPMKAQMQIDVAIDELFGNIALYGYPDGDGDITVRFGFDEAEREASVTFIDSGVPFDPLETEIPDVKASSEDRKIGGLGIFLVRKTMDGMEYEYKDGKNHTTIKKKI